MANDKPAKPDPDEMTPAEKTEAARKLREELEAEMKKNPKPKDGK